MRLRFALPALYLLLHASAAHAGGAWSYDGETDNQDTWGRLSPDYATCDDGRQQSPINIGETAVAALPALGFHYRASPVTLHREAHRIWVDVGGDNRLTIGGMMYALRHITWHTPGEHKRLGRFWLGEFQLVHESADGKTLIVSVMIDTISDLPALQPLLDHIPARTGDTDTVAFDPSVLLPKERGYFAYTGSLTTPPCTEGIAWRVLKDTLHISRQQLHALAHANGRNARATQPVYMRTVEESKE